MDRPRDSAGAARRRAIFEEAVAEIEQRYVQVSLVELAQAIFTSKRQLQRAFAEAGTSFQTTLHTIRMERSAELLVASSLSVCEISHLVGYRSSPRFAKAFRRHYQLTPRQLRSLKSNSTTNEALSGGWKCGCQPDPPLGAPLPPRPRRDERQPGLERRSEQLDSRLQEFDKAA